MNKTTFTIIETGIELVAMGRAAMSTYLVVLYVTGGNIPYTILTVGIIEGLLLVSLMMLRHSSIAPITAVVALVFTAVTQVMELQVLDGTITAGEREIMRYVIALAPVTILGLAYIRRMADGVDLEAIAHRIGSASERLTGAERVELPPAHNAESIPARMKASANGVRGDADSPND